jgi:hypothetical protein
MHWHPLAMHDGIIAGVIWYQAESNVLSKTWQQYPCMQVQPTTSVIVFRLGANSPLASRNASL